MDTIIISDLAVAYCVGVSEAERAHPQRLLLTLEIEIDFAEVALTDDLTRTVDYHAVCQRLLVFGKGRSWKLLETLAVEIATLVRRDFGALKVTVEIKKFILPETQFVGVRVTR